MEPVWVEDYRDKLRTFQKLGFSPRQLDLSNVVFNDEVTATDLLDEFPGVEFLQISGNMPGKFLPGLKRHTSLKSICITLSPIYSSKCKFVIPKYVESISIFPMSILPGKVLEKLLTRAISRRHKTPITLYLETPALILDMGRVTIPSEIRTIAVSQRRNHRDDFKTCMRENGFVRKCRTDFSTIFERGLDRDQEEVEEEEEGFNGVVTLEDVLNKILNEFGS